MLAYRHGFHAGNHADVLKHLVLTRVLRYLREKDKPFRYIDTHAGAGGYLLKGAQAQKTAEYREGIGRLWSRADLPPLTADYVRLVQEFNLQPGEDGQAPVLEKGMTPPLALYPGSPSIARQLMRRGDSMRLFELHPSDARTLSAHFGGNKHVQVLNEDGFAGLKGQVPPTPRRALVLMDPSYELVQDYGKVVTSLREAVQRFAEGVYMVWYPQVSRVEAVQLPKRLTALAPKGWLHVRLTVAQPDPQGFGLVGSGVFILNPPWTLHQELAAELPFLVDALAQFDGASYLIEEQPA
ncbi:23S rRNA (adenine(2030)-N(6))-methyltransferase RlmJ [Ideonella sp. B7]|uniref:23S rRNA (adenine(2030)-N(6))-methyltransferase RlmJ n=1 Tax=Ideonella benzenivorans TaxID=2831643 RepID=UPI001CED6DD0|nr:23S rRNA (adenine(2030)-N(6))-methyltransferase RlmJ [Ideonella benzenivorans]MCA6218280.1 23S rRNA (adenine(2030)-N(6))-methyltransferase RlmJ [Ideonella benzenivorans]